MKPSQGTLLQCSEFVEVRLGLPLPIEECVPNCIMASQVPSCPETSTTPEAMHKGILNLIKSSKIPILIKRVLEAAASARRP